MANKPLIESELEIQSSWLVMTIQASLHRLCNSKSFAVYHGSIGSACRQEFQACPWHWAWLPHKNSRLGFVCPPTVFINTNGRVTWWINTPSKAYEQQIDPMKAGLMGYSHHHQSHPQRCCNGPSGVRCGAHRTVFIVNIFNCHPFAWNSLWNETSAICENINESMIRCTCKKLSTHFLVCHIGLRHVRICFGVRTTAYREIVVVGCFPRYLLFVLKAVVRFWSCINHKKTHTSSLFCLFLPLLWQGQGFVGSTSWPCSSCFSASRSSCMRHSSNSFSEHSL